jgi:hypothetical protein
MEFKNIIPTVDAKAGTYINNSDPAWLRYLRLKNPTAVAP